MKLRQSEPVRADRSSALGLLLLSALWAVAWLRKDLIPDLGADALSPVQGQAALFAVFTVVAACIAATRRVEFPRGRQAWACAGIGVGLFVIPAMLAAWAQDSVSKFDEVIVFSLTPVFAVVLEPYLQGSRPRQGKGSLAGAVAAVAGVLFLLPLDISGSFRVGAALCVLLVAAFCIAVANCLAVRLARNLEGRSVLPMSAQAAAAGAVCFAAAAAFTPHASWRWSAPAPQLLALLLVDLPALLLLFWLMRRVAASRMTARFLLAPLFAVLGGMVLEPASPPGRTWFGMLLLAGGAGWLVFAPEEEIEVQELDLLNPRTEDIPRQPPAAT